MSEPLPGRAAVIRFGAFDLDLRAGDLSKAGVQTRLPSLPLEILVLLLRHPGRVVTRDDLRARVWPNAAPADFEHGVEAAMERLRETLGDDADHPRFIETIAGQGYRFIAPLDVAAEADPAATGPAPVSDAAGSDPGAPEPDHGRYELRERIGAGGMGEVFRARDLRLDRDVAIKFLPAWLAEDPTALRRFHREAQSAAALNHPNVLDVHDVAVLNGTPCIVSELLDGRTLRWWMQQGRLPVTQALAYATQVLAGLGAAHARGIVHRDLKPENLFITRDGRVKILDFGIAKLAGREAQNVATTTTATAAGAIIGTVAYMSPEQVQGLAVDGRSDIFSFGVVLYEMTTGVRPFTGATRTAVISSILKDTPTLVSALNPELPAELSRIVQRCLQKAPEERYQNALDLRSDLVRLEQPDAGRTRERASGWRHLPGRVVLGRAAVAAIVVVALGWAASAGWRALSRRDGTNAAPAGPPPMLWMVPHQVTSAPGWETHPALSADGTLIAYTSNEAGNADIWVVASGGGDAVNVTRNDANDEKPAWFPDHSALAFASDRGGRWNVWKAPPLGGGASLLVPNARDPAISPDGSQIAFVRPDATGNPRVTIAPLDDLSRARTATDAPDRLAEPEEDPAWSPDGTLLCYSSYRSLWVVPVAGGKGRRLTLDREVDIEPAWSADGRSIYFSSLRGGIYALWRVASSGGVPEPLTRGSGPERHPTVSRDGTRLAFSNFKEDSDLVLHGLRTGEEHLLGTTRDETCPALSPDGGALVYVCDSKRGGGTELWLQPLAAGRPTGAPRRLADQPGSVSQPSYSRDGLWIVYQRVLDANRDIWTIPATGGEPVRFTDDPTDDVHPAWSPNGDAIAFASGRGGAEHIWVAPVRDGHPAGPARQITRQRGNQEKPAWSPDGRRIAYIAPSVEGAEVWVVRADGAGLPQRVSSGVDASWLRWDPLGRGVIVRGTWGEGALSLRLLDPATRVVTPFKPPVRIGDPSADPIFNVSRDGGTVAFSRAMRSGDIWVTEIRR